MVTKLVTFWSSLLKWASLGHLQWRYHCWVIRHCMMIFQTWTSSILVLSLLCLHWLYCPLTAWLSLFCVHPKYSLIYLLTHSLAIPDCPILLLLILLYCVFTLNTPKSPIISLFTPKYPLATLCVPTYPGYPKYP